MRYLTSSEICSELRISKTTLMKWKRLRKVQVKELSQKKILYDIDSIVSIESQPSAKRVAIYARVSNTKQKADLDRQVELLRTFVVSRGDIIHSIHKDIASGMNENRINLNKLISLVQNRDIDEVVISFKDRLTRFGFEYFQNWFSRFDVKITIVNSTKEEDFQQELTQDLISIIHHFSMKLYSNRRRIVTDCKNQLKSTETQCSEF